MAFMFHENEAFSSYRAKCEVREGMEKYFWEEGYFEYLEKWYNYFNSISTKLTDEKLEGLMTANRFELIKDWWEHDATEESTNDDEG